MLPFIAVLVGKIIAYLSRYLKIGGGSAAPGLFALRIDPELVEGLSKKIPRHVVITGTNGKTTTARMLAHFAQEAGLKVIRNHTGSNLERGIASTLISRFTLYPLPFTLSFDLGIWELDEAAFNSVVHKIKPDIVVFLNVFRDQLDRYGEVDSVIKRWCATLKSLPKSTTVLVNGDDVNTLKLKECFKGKTETFGAENYKIIGESIEKEKSNHKLDFEAKNIKLRGLDGTRFELFINHKSLIVNLPLPGIYHIYDAIAALSCAYHLNMPIPRLTESLKNFQPAFGRVEKFSLQPGRLKRKNDGYIFLIKNPAGATQVFETIAPQLKPKDRLLIALNDNLADGTDVSWIWDANFEELRNSSRAKSRDYSIICSGTRAYDLAVRLKYAGFDRKYIQVEPSLQNALKQAIKGLKGTLYILPTYTAMLEIQKILAKIRVKGNYWEEN